MHGEKRVNRQVVCAMLILLLALVATQCYADVRPPSPDELKAMQVARDKKQSGWSPASTRSIVAAVAASIGLAGIVLLRMKRTKSTPARDDRGPLEDNPNRRRSE